MEITQVLFGILSVLEFGLLVVINLKGLIYDGLKEDIDKKYTGNHSFSFKHGRFLFSLPLYIKENTTDKLKAAAKIYNRYSLLFWLNIVLLVVLYNVAY